MLEIRNVRKTYGSLVAVDDVSFSVERGRLTGLLGPNGAGKTTTVSMIAGLISPERGEVLVGGDDDDEAFGGCCQDLFACVGTAASLDEPTGG